MLFEDATTVALTRALDATALRQRVTSDNIANVMTPGFTARRVDFERALGEAVRSGRPGSAQASVVPTSAAAREDGNNVVLEEELGGLMRAGLQYQAVAQAVSFKHSLLRAAVRG